jgi:hypothetical protein
MFAMVFGERLKSFTIFLIDIPSNLHLIMIFISSELQWKNLGAMIDDAHLQNSNMQEYCKN